MIQFKRYSSIANHTNKKYIDEWLEYMPELMHCKYSITEKIDGCNIVIFFSSDFQSDGIYKVGRRNGWLEDGEDIFGVKEFLKANEFILQNLYNTCITSFESFFPNGSDAPIDNYRVYLEYYGKGVNDRIYYGPKKYLKIIDIMYGGFFIPGECYNFDGNLLSMSNNLEDALNFDVEKKYNFAFNGEAIDREIEGVVVRPMINCYRAGFPMFSLKIKRKSFNERSPTKQIKRKEHSEIQCKFLEYVNENRVFSVFSKEGAISNFSDMGKYIKLTIDDAIESFGNDFPDVDTSDKSIYRAGGPKASAILRAIGFK